MRIRVAGNHRILPNQEALYTKLPRMLWGRAFQSCLADLLWLHSQQTQPSYFISHIFHKITQS